MVSKGTSFLIIYHFLLQLFLFLVLLHLVQLQGSIGAVIRDDRGFFVAAVNQLIGQVYGAAIAEAYAILHGLLMHCMGCNRVMVNSSYMEVITTL